MRLLWSATLLLTLALPPSAQAEPIVIDFENLGDLESLTTQYPGVAFSNAVALTAGLSLNEFDFPPRSGTTAVSDDFGPMTISFATPVENFGGFFTYVSPLTITAFDAGNNIVATATSLYASNLALDPGSVPNEFVGIAFAGGISSVLIAGDALGGSFVMDDMTTNTSVPEPATLSMLLLGGVGLVLGRRRHIGRCG